MQHSCARLRLFVKSRKVPVGVTEFSLTTPVGQWVLSHSRVRAVVYDRVLDAAQAKLVEEAKQLSRSAGLDLEVVDLGKMGVLRRIFSSPFVGVGNSAVVAVTPSSSGSLRLKRSMRPTS